jgi:hypothetical protein
MRSSSGSDSGYENRGSEPDSSDEDVQGSGVEVHSRESAVSSESDYLDSGEDLPSGGAPQVGSRDDSLADEDTPHAKIGYFGAERETAR